MNFQKGFSVVLSVIIILALLGGGLYVWQKTKSVINVTYEPIVDEATKDWQTYRNEEYGFEFKYPSNWGITDLFIEDRGPQLLDHVVYVSALGASIFYDTADASLQISLNGDSGMADWLVHKKKIIDDQFIVAYLTLWSDAGRRELRAYFRSQNPDKKLVPKLIATEVDEDMFNQILSTFKFIN